MSGYIQNVKFDQNSMWKGFICQNPTWPAGGLGIPRYEETPLGRKEVPIISEKEPITPWKRPFIPDPPDPFPWIDKRNWK